MVPLPPHKFRYDSQICEPTNNCKTESKGILYSVSDIASIDPPTSSGSDRGGGKSKKSRDKDVDSGASTEWGKVSGVVSGGS